jgi:hypothetical protein
MITASFNQFVDCTLTIDNKEYGVFEYYTQGWPVLEKYAAENNLLIRRAIYNWFQYRLVPFNDTTYLNGFTGPSKHIEFLS